MRKIHLIIGLALLLAAALYGQAFFPGARAIGMGDAYTALALDGTAIRWNPGATALMEMRNITGGFSKLYWGVDGDNIGQGYLGYVQNLTVPFSLGVGWTNFFSSVYNENRFHLNLSYHLLPNLGVGLTSNLEMAGYDKSAFKENPDETANIRQSPLFVNNGTSKMGFSADIGALYLPRKDLRVGLAISNLIAPNTSLKSVSEGKSPLSGALGAAYIYHGNLTAALDLRFTNWTINEGSNKIDVGLGVEGWLAQKTIGIRGGINPRFFSVGGTYWVMSHPEFEFNYAFIYPLSKLGQISTSHRLSVTMRMPYPVHKPKIDLIAVSLEPDKNNVAPDQGVKISGTIERRLDMEAKKIAVSALVQTPDGKYDTLDTRVIADLKAQTSVSWRYSPRTSGKYTISMTVDPENAYKETDETNNFASSSFDVIEGPEITVDADKKLIITHASIRKTEEPLMPMVFFTKGGFSYEPRYDYLLSRIAERLGDNPDVILHLRGFYNPITDGKGKNTLALNRAEVVYRRLLIMGAEPSQLVVDTTGYGPSAIRAGKHLPMEKDRDVTYEENRRVELSLEIKGKPTGFTQPVRFAKGSDTTPASISGADVWKDYLSRNKDMILLAEGSGGTNETSDPTIGLRRAGNIKKALAALLPGMSDRIYIFEKKSDKPVGDGFVTLLADGVLFAPYAGRAVPTGMTLSPSTNTVRVRYKSSASVASHDVGIWTTTGEPVVELSAAPGAPAASYEWNWTDANGNIISPDARYVVKGELVDENSLAAVDYSDTITVEMKEVVDIIQNIFIVIFNFDTDEPISPYFETRLETVCRRFIENAERKGYSLTATVEGHTDVIGLPRRNTDLSKERSTREFDNIRKYLQYMLGLNSPQELDNWIAEHNARLVHKGFGPAKPYEIEKQVAGVKTPVLLGDNKIPEGRNINRRVMVELKLEPLKL